MTKETITPPVYVPSVSDYVAAFKKIESRMTDNQHKMLVNHHASPGYVTTSRNLGHSVGFSDYNAANLQYGKLAIMLADAMGIAWRDVSMLVLFGPKGSETNTEWLWIMRENVAQALEELSWVSKTSDLFFPQGYDPDELPHEDT
jgi:hypothetical protein